MASGKSVRSQASNTLAEALPESVFFGPHPVFIESIQSYWAMQERDVVPQCIVKPRNTKEVALAMTALKRSYGSEKDSKSQGTSLRFAVRSGGHSPVPSAANEHDGIVVDLSLLRDMSVSEDNKTITAATGCRWGDVYKLLDQKGLTTAGGRASGVGVGGLTLGGGISFISPQVGFVCNNIVSYEVVLANGSVVTASETTNAKLWRALKGGANNFGIVTSFEMRVFPCSQVWGGFLYMLSNKAGKVIDEFHEFAKATPETYDEHAAGPLCCFSYVQPIGIQAIAITLVYTKPEKWPACFQGFNKIGRVWSTNKVQRMGSVADELNSSSPPGKRQLFCTTTMANDHATLRESHAAYARAKDAMRGVKGLVWTLVLQPLHPATAARGQPDVLGLADRTRPLVIVLFTAVWTKKEDDAIVNETAKAAIGSIDSFAGARGAADSYRYLNDCAAWQHPFAGYGEENLEFLRSVSREYDPEAMFQRACKGGFKLEME